MAGHSRRKDGVAFARLRPAIHVFLPDLKTWLPGTRPGMTDLASFTFLNYCPANFFIADLIDAAASS